MLAPPSRVLTAVDGFIEEKRHKGFVYTGKLRAVMPVEPVPKRTLPDHIQRPDYATEGELIASAQQRWSAVWGGRILGKAEEVGRTIAYGLRDVSTDSLLGPPVTHS